MKTADLIGPALDWAVAKIEELDAYIPSYALIPWVQYRDCHGQPHPCPKFHEDWNYGGPIIEREKMKIRPGTSSDGDAWVAATTWGEWSCVGPTALVAAMRCYVASKLGDEVEIPEELKV